MAAISDHVTQNGPTRSEPGYEKRHDPDHLAPNLEKYRYLKTATILIGFFTMGVAASVIGPSIVSMEAILGVDTQTISWALTGKSLGFLLGTVTSGLLYSRLSKELLFTVFFFSLGLSTFCIPLVDNFAYFVCLLALHGTSIGVTDAAGQGYMLYNWIGHRRQHSMFQMMYTAWSVGTGTGPFVMAPFLVDIQTNETIDTSKYLSSDQINGTSCNRSSQIINLEDVSHVKYGYMIAGGTQLIPLVLLVSYQVLSGFSCREKSPKSKATTHKVNKETTGNKWGKIIFLILAVTALFWYAFVESLTHSYIATYAVKALGMSNKNGGLVTSVFFIGTLIMRVVGIFTVRFLSARTLLYVHSMCVVASYGLLMLSYLEYWIIWCAAFFAGLSISAIQACIFLWAKKYLDMSGKLPSLFMTSCSAGQIIGTLIAGIIFGRFGLHSFAYVVFVGSVCLCSTFMIADIFSKRNLTQNDIPCDAIINIDQGIKNQNKSIDP